MSDATDWISAIGSIGGAVATSAAVVTALWLAGKQDRASTRRQEREQAEKITAWYIDFAGPQPIPGRLMTGIRIKNASDQVVYDLVAQVVGLQGSFRRTAVGDTAERNYEYGAPVGNIPPGEVDSFIDGSGGGMHRRFGVEFAFQDAAGRFWLRRGNGTLDRVSDLIARSLVVLCARKRRGPRRHGLSFKTELLAGVTAVSNGRNISRRDIGRL
jgi:hypothetical protein